MTDSTLMIESLRLMGIGMGIVFSFLLLLVGIVRSMSWVAHRLAPAEQPPLKSPALGDQAGPSDELIAVISAAVARYRASR
jgi:oxaloacetate decarboxylase gamma subunit